MMLRWLVANYIRQTARQKIERAASDALRGHASAPEAPPEGEPLPPCQLALLFATAIESDGLVNLLARRVTTRCASYLEHAGMLKARSVVVAESGSGAQAAAQATEDVIAVHGPQWIVCAGFAAALDAALRRGQIVMADHVIDLQGRRLSVGFKMDSQSLQQARGLRVGTLLTVDRMIATPEQRRQLGREHPAVACDMETMAVASVCRRRKVRFLSVRVVSDALEDRWPVEIQKLSRQKTFAGKLGAATGAVFKRPGAVKDMWRLREEALKASDRLARFLAAIVLQLAEPAAS